MSQVGVRREPLLCDLVAEQALRTPDATAIRQWDESLSYAELLAAAARLAARLKRRGVGPETRVGICGRRTPDLPAAVLGVLLAGGAYVPLDPGHPRRRLTGIVDDAGIEIVLADAAGAERLDGAGPEILDLSAPSGEPWEVPPCAALPGNAAYVLYTSGSTGRPKGVVVGHASVVAFTTAVGELFGIDASCRGIGFAALGFDVSVLDLFVPLAHGGSVQLIPDEDRVDPARLQRFLEAHDVTWGAVPPALLPLLDPERLPRLRHLITAGEPPGPEQVARWSAPPRRRFYNWYGPTETTVCVVGAELTGAWDAPLPIGRALAGCRAHVLDERMRECPPGAPGELYIGGPQLARGYLDRPGLTAERFVPDPLAGEPGERLYRTGDRVRLEPGGQLAFLGRLDRQVKIRGQRVELGEVEAVLRGHPSVRQAVVDVAGRDELIAYLAPGTAPGLEELRSYCADRLPGYMIPVRAVRTELLPLTAAGKVDMAALRGSDGRSAAERRPPASAVERAVAAAWARAFGGGEPGLDDDFFTSGGHSLLAMRLVAALRARLGRDIAVEDVLAGRTVAGLAARVERAAPIERSPASAGPALSSAQRRMWFVEQLAPGTPVHNIAMAQRMRGPLDVAALRRALTAVVERHEALRWRVANADGVPAVSVRPADEAPLPVEDLAGPAALRERLEAEARTPFDLAEGPLWRARLLRTGPSEHVLALTVHHLVFDGWSQDVLYADLARAYAGADLAPLPSTFDDYVAGSRDREAQRGLGDARWWSDHLAGAPTLVDLPRDGARPAAQTFRGAARQAELGPELSARVRGLSARLGATPYAVLLAAFGQLLRRLTGEHDLVVGTPLADRGDADLAPLVGCCLRILPLRLRVSDGDGFAEHVRACQAEVGAAIAHADAPLERIVDALDMKRDLTRGSLIQVLFNMYDFAEPRLDLPGVDAEPLPPGLPGSLFDLTLYVSERGHLQVVYNPDLYDEARIDALLAGYARLLAQLVEEPDRPVRRASLRDGSLPDGTEPLPGWDGPGVVEQVARSRADAVAVTGAGGTLTYGDVEAIRRDTAAALEPGEAIGVLARRHVALPAQLLGVLSSGARWAILDPALPPRRLARQAAAAGVRALLCGPGIEPGEELAHLPVIRPAPGEAPVVAAADRGYLAFTSGTTGEPKLVVTPERPLARFLDWYPRAFGLTARDRFALLSGLAHDPMLRDAFTPLAIGAVLCVPEPECLADPARLAAWLADERVTVLHLTPQLARMLAGVPGGALPALRLAVLGGDRLTQADVARVRRLAPTARIVNAYGTTETPQIQAIHEPAEADATDFPVPVGRGVDGAQLLVLDAAGRPAGAGELGEVVVRGHRLAAGDTYRTGDLGRYRPDGLVVLAGRADDQVKVRGFRVELGEVEAALGALPGIRAAAAIVVPAASGEVALRGYAVPDVPGIRAAELRDRLRAQLPDHAVPADVVLLGALPLTPNGKVDRAALPAPAPRPAGRAGDDLRTPAERLVAGVWRAVLGLPRVGARDNFFDVGGHSLAMAEVQARLTERLGRPVPIVELFRHPNVRALAVHLDGDGHATASGAAARRAAARRARRRAGAGSRGSKQDDGERDLR